MKYRTIVADPPWPMPDSGVRTNSTKGNWGPYLGQVASTIPYNTMGLEEICELPISNLAEPNAHIYVWTVNRYIRKTYELVEAWGFRPSTLLTWCKAPMGIGLGGTFTNASEFILFARRGSLKATTRVDRNWWQWKRGPHSAKPEAFLDLVEQVSPGPYLELFSRRARLGWDVWGDESLQTVELAS